MSKLVLLLAVIVGLIALANYSEAFPEHKGLGGENQFQFRYSRAANGNSSNYIIIAQYLRLYIID